LKRKKDSGMQHRNRARGEGGHENLILACSSGDLEGGREQRAGGLQNGCIVPTGKRLQPTETGGRCIADESSWRHVHLLCWGRGEGMSENPPEGGKEMGSHIPGPRSRSNPRRPRGLPNAQLQTRGGDEHCRDRPRLTPCSSIN